MLNSTHNNVFILLPEQNLSAFCRQLSGPSDWPMPSIVGGGSLTSSRTGINALSNHDRMFFLSHQEEILRAFLDYAIPLGWPAWMKPSLHDLEVHYRTGKLWSLSMREKFSLPALLPWTGPDEFAIWFPDATPDALVWTPIEVDDPPPLHWVPAPTLFRMSRIGCDSPPSVRSVSYDRKLPYLPGMSLVRCYFKLTSWSPRFFEAFRSFEDVLLRHEARLILAWKEEFGTASGYVHVDPVAGEFSTQLFEETAFLSETEEDGNTYTDIDHRRFAERLVEEIPDKDFSRLLINFLG